MTVQHKKQGYCRMQDEYGGAFGETGSPEAPYPFVLKQLLMNGRGVSFREPFCHNQQYG
ncbi:hypothetical protein [Pleomorphomonas sp. PLEO]|uniref:hypothetical protein n=1 Tax=Pleomorphomonas sp. PLEO TaxID=3239306 RepID=UPI00351E5808